jgi:hypothetical protein
MISERVDDISLVLAQLERIGVQRLLEAHVPTPGHGVGLRLGGVPGVWLPPLLSRRIIGGTTSNPGRRRGSIRCGVVPDSPCTRWT